MHDGFETKRSRGSDSRFEEAVIELGPRASVTPLHFVDLDFSYFVNNNPQSIELWHLPAVESFYVRSSYIMLQSELSGTY